MTFFQNFVGSLLVSVIIFAFLFVAAFLIVLRLIKRGSGLFMKFWGADIYTFNLQEDAACFRFGVENCISS